MLSFCYSFRKRVFWHLHCSVDYCPLVQPCSWIQEVRFDIKLCLRVFNGFVLTSVL